MQILYNTDLNQTENTMPPKEYSFKVKGVLINEKDKSEMRYKWTSESK